MDIISQFNHFVEENFNKFLKILNEKLNGTHHFLMFN